MGTKRNHVTAPFYRRLLDALAGDWADPADRSREGSVSDRRSVFLRQLLDALAGDWSDPGERPQSQLTSLYRSGFSPRLIDALAGDWDLAADADGYRESSATAAEAPPAASRSRPATKDPVEDLLFEPSLPSDDSSPAAHSATSSTKSAIVFVHGMFSSPNIWHSLTGLLKTDDVIADRFDLHFFEYPSPLAGHISWRKVPDLGSLASSLATYLQFITLRHRRVILVTHSIGGLVVQRYLADMIKAGRGMELRKILGVVMFAPPSSSSAVVLLARRVRPFTFGSQMQQLRSFASETTELHRLISRRIVHATRPSADQYPLPVKAYVGERDVIVSQASAIDSFPSTVVLPGDHTSIVKPTDTHAAQYRALRNDLLQFIAIPSPLAVPTGQVVAIAPDSSFVAAGDAEGTVRVWNAVTGRLRHTIGAHSGPVLALATAPDASFILTGSSDGTAKLWNSASGRLEHAMTAQGSVVRAVAVSPDSSFVVTGSSDGAVQIWESTTGALRHTMTVNSSPVQQLAVAPDGSFIVAGSSDGTVVIWDSATGESRHTRANYTGSVEMVAVAPDSSFVVTGTSEGSIMVLNVASANQ